MMLLVVVSVVTAIDECQDAVNPSDVPCTILSSYQYGNGCGTYQVKIYNNTPALIDTVHMTDYGVTGYCNITFNYSTQGTYFLNFSAGESATVKVEEDSMAFVAVSIILLGLLVAVIYTATKVKGQWMQIFLSLIGLVLITLTFYFSASIIHISYPQYTGLEDVFWTFYGICTTLIWVSMAFAIVVLIFQLFKNFMLDERRKRGLDEDDLYG